MSKSKAVKNRIEKKMLEEVEAKKAEAPEPIFVKVMDIPPKTVDFENLVALYISLGFQVFAAQEKRFIWIGSKRGADALNDRLRASIYLAQNKGGTMQAKVMGHANIIKPDGTIRLPGDLTQMGEEIPEKKEQDETP